MTRVQNKRHPSQKTNSNTENSANGFHDSAWRCRVFVIILIARLVFGIMHWQQPAGKIVAVASGLLLASLVAFVAVVLILAVSAQRGAPM